ncbi:hypothetical protein CCAX7_55890 [Capsulimonas corticalis]|uniref:Uncharacterized protein n=1 Tax=Capsulimonas corticalis TaxID=2219043 RepID=A0A402D0Q2_9BACT|nr:SpoIIE family protein phosphatase [Capsulimonas corticalis]BDI33538.1 hypothetical protein CCAX7_55890 [Capsulimonas corticalis]
MTSQQPNPPPTPEPNNDSVLPGLRILDSVTDAFFALDREWRFTYLNSHAERLLMRTREDLLGQSIWDEFPDAVGSAFEYAYRRAMNQQEIVQFEAYYDPKDNWFEVRGFPSEDSLTVCFREIGDRKRAEQDRLRVDEELRDAHERTIDILESIGDAFYTLDSQFRLTYVNRRSAELWERTREELIGQRIQDVFPQWEGSISHGHHIAAMTERTPRHYETFSLVLNKWLEVNIYPAADGLSVYYRDIHSRKMADDALRASEERFRRVADTIPHIVWTAQPDGALDYVNQRWLDYTGLNARETYGWAWRRVIHPDELPRVAAIYAEAIADGENYEDEFRMRRLDGVYRTFLVRGAAIKGEAGETVKWVGTCTDVTERRIEADRQAAIFEREHTIATQLQEALQPPIPRAMPGLSLAKYYEPALPESGVGGDFMDCFAVRPGVTAIVVGDVSGKGLAAAAQVATVRNMLRYAMHNEHALADSVARLNDTIAANLLLSGFCTLFVGCYDADTRTFTYVNAGQESALLRRAATGEIEQLASTGSVIGAFTPVEYDSVTLTLTPGDALAIFTDGLTECGPTRETMLGVDGVSALLRDPPAPNSDASIAEVLAMRLIDGVDAIAQDGLVRDDVCLIIAVAE